MPRLDKHYPKQLFDGLRRRRARPKGLPQKPLIESLPCFDIRLLRDNDCWPRDWIASRAYSPGFQLTSVRRFKLYRSRIDIVLISGKTQTLAIDWHTQRGARYFRGRYARPNFVCGCNRKARKLYLLGGLFCCRRCCWRSGCRYASQVANKFSRAMLQAKRLRTFIIGYPVDNQRIPDKPFMWKWGSYDRLIARLARLQDRARKQRKPRRSKRVAERIATRPLWNYDVRTGRD